MELEKGWTFGQLFGFSSPEEVQKDIKEVKDHCEQETWKGDTCDTLKNNITTVCNQNDPWKPMVMGEGEDQVELDCPEISKSFSKK